MGDPLAAQPENYFVNVGGVWLTGYPDVMNAFLLKTNSTPPSSAEQNVCVAQLGRSWAAALYAYRILFVFLFCNIYTQTEYLYTNWML